jgi:predicted nucleotidyltransferase component of viral defense system
MKEGIENLKEKIEKMKKISREIQALFRNFYLAGGTALMLKHKHRISEDLDFFSENPFSFLRLSSKIRRFFKVSKEERFEDNIDFIIDDIKVSFVFFPFKNIKPIEKIEGIKVASDYDIFLNKIYSAGRRIESKDIVDFAFLWRKYRWEIKKVRRDFERKFPNQSFEIYLGAIFYIEDYPEIDKSTAKIINEIKKEWIEKNTF